VVGAACGATGEHTDRSATVAGAHRR
jgi:hypothetical protein